MSTNYYVHVPPSCGGKCDTHCHETVIHLGKWGGGGEFHFRAYPDAGNRLAEITWDVVDYESWSRLLDLGQVVTEAGREVTATEMATEVVPEPGRVRWPSCRQCA